MNDLVVTLLTGRRPHLLARTLESAEDVGLWRWEDLHVIPFLNGDDRETRDVLTNWFCGWAGSEEWMSIGVATSMCAKLAYESGKRFWLHLEDDWEAQRAPEDWLQECCNLLEFGRVDQVRLRDSREKVLKQHMVTGQPIWWKQEGHFDLGEAHLTFNPMLIRTADVLDAFPCEGEREAQRKWLAAGHRIVAQHYPGIWRHIGGSDSLRGGQR